MLKKNYVTSLVFMVLFVMVVAILVSLYAGRAIAKEHAPLSHMSMEIAHECTIAHLWFEEIMSGDKTVSLDEIWDHLEKANQLSTDMLEKQKRLSSVMLSLGENLEADINEILEGIAVFKKVAERRWANKDNAGIGSDTDQQFDVVFQELLLDIHNVDTTIQDSMNKQLEIFELIQMALALTVILAGTFVGVLLRRNESKLTENILQLENSHHEIVLLNNELETKVAKRTLELETANKHLKELDRVKSMFIASMSHELRTPLNSIIGFSSMIVNDMAGPVSSQQFDYIQRVNRSGKHLLSLITDVIDISKIEAGKIAVYYKDFSFNEVLDEALESIESNLHEKGLELTTKVPDSINMHSDRKRLLQCILNLLSNAIKYSEKGTIKVEVTSDEKRLKLSVSDTGIGMSKEDMKQLFQAFTRFESRLKIINSGTGLGLYLTKKLAKEVLGGDISATSVVDKGSTFILDIPLVTNSYNSSKEENV